MPLPATELLPPGIAEHPTIVAAGVQAGGAAALPAALARVEIPPVTSAVFSRTAHIAQIAARWEGICGQRLPALGCTLGGEPRFELCTDVFDPRQGIGLGEVWIPLKAGEAA